MSSTTDHTNFFLRREVAAIVGWGWFWGGDGGGRFRRGDGGFGGRRLAGVPGVLKVDYGKMGDITYSAAGIKFCLPFWLCLTNEVRSSSHLDNTLYLRHC